MNDLLKQVLKLKKSSVGKAVDKRLKEFSMPLAEPRRPINNKIPHQTPTIVRIDLNLFLLRLSYTSCQVSLSNKNFIR